MCFDKFEVRKWLIGMFDVIRIVLGILYRKEIVYGSCFTKNNI